MKMEKALELLSESPCQGYMVRFAWKVKGRARADCFFDYFSEKRAGDELIQDVEEAWRLADKFARVMQIQAERVCVVDDNYSPVGDYKERMSARAPKKGKTLLAQELSLVFLSLGIGWAVGVSVGLWLGFTIGTW